MQIAKTKKINLKRIIKVVFFIALCSYPLAMILPLLLPTQNMPALITELDKKHKDILPAITDTYDSILSGNYESIIEHVSKYDPESASFYQDYFDQTVTYLKQFNTINEEIIGLHCSFSLGGVPLSINAQKEFELISPRPGTVYLMLNLELTRLDNTWVLTGITADTAKISIKEINQVSWSKMLYAEKLMIIALICIPLFVLITEYVCLFKTNVKYKWLWTLFILFGVTNLSHTFTQHITTFYPNSIMLYGASFWRPGLYAELIVEIGIPLGAIIFMVMYVVKYRRTFRDAHK